MPPFPLASAAAESVTAGHPDKLCDAVSDAVLDACLAQDRCSRVACEAAVKGNFMLVFGEVSSSARVDFDAIARRVAAGVGYTSADVGFDSARAEIKVTACMCMWRRPQLLVHAWDGA